jgi:hypothetical protein
VWLAMQSLYDSTQVRARGKRGTTALLPPRRRVKALRAFIETSDAENKLFKVRFTSLEMQLAKNRRTPFAS